MFALSQKSTRNTSSTGIRRVGANGRVHAWCTFLGAHIYSPDDLLRSLWYAVHCVPDSLSRSSRGRAQAEEGSGAREASEGGGEKKTAPLANGSLGYHTARGVTAQCPSPLFFITQFTQADYTLLNKAIIAH